MEFLFFWNNSRSIFFSSFLLAIHNDRTYHHSKEFSKVFFKQWNFFSENKHFKFLRFKCPCSKRQWSWCEIFSSNMKIFFERNIASKGWHVYGKTVWQNLLRDEKLEAKKEDNEDATKVDLYTNVWKVKRKDKLVPVVVGHIPREILRFIKFFLNYSGRIEVKVFSSQYKASSIPSGGLEIHLAVKFLISKEKSVILKDLHYLIDLIYEELL